MESLKFFVRLVFCLVCLLLWTACFAGCGYHLQSLSKGTLPGGVERVAVSRVINPSLETWIEPRIRTALSEELQKRGQAQVVIRNQAQALLEVRIVTYSSGVKVQNAQEETVKSAVSITVQARLLRRQPAGELIWQSSPIFVQESFVSSGGQAAVLKAGYRAVDLAVERLADQLYQNF